MTEPLFSVILPTFNRATFVSGAIQSVLKQELEDWELIVVDDGSTDNTAEVVRSFSDGRIQYHHQENAERNFARNEGVDLARGRYITFLDSDDYLKADHLAEFARRIQLKPESKLFFNAYQREGGDGRKFFLHQKEQSDLIDALVWENKIVPMSLAIERQFLKQIRFPPSRTFIFGEDQNLWLRMIAREPIDRSHKITAVQVVHDERSVGTNSHEIVLNSMEESLELLRTDSIFMKRYSKQLKRLEASFRSLAALQAVLNGHKGISFGLLWQSIQLNSKELGRRRSFAILAKLLFR
jgi:glycosyltransferase involved in cell wall biosynthesis